MRLDRPPPALTLMSVSELSNRIPSQLPSQIVFALVEKRASAEPKASCEREETDFSRVPNVTEYARNNDDVCNCDPCCPWGPAEVLVSVDSHVFVKRISYRAVQVIIS